MHIVFWLDATASKPHLKVKWRLSTTNMVMRPVRFYLSATWALRRPGP
jgi:hypothetical protein